MQADELRKEISKYDKRLDEVKASISKSEYAIDSLSSDIAMLEKNAAETEIQIH